LDRGTMLHVLDVLAFTGCIMVTKEIQTILQSERYLPFLKANMVK
jgi:hypothetical protein